MNISANSLEVKEINEKVREAGTDVTISDCYGERFIGSGLDSKTITINGTPGNALGTYLDGAVIIVNGNVQDAVGDTMNDGKIIVHGNAGDALGYAMRGGKIFVGGNSGYRTGIHMKEYKEKYPVIVVGGSAGSFLGEYLAGGKIIVLGLESETESVGNFTGTGMHGGEIWIRADEPPQNLPSQVSVKKTSPDEIYTFLKEYADIFQVSIEKIVSKNFFCLKPNVKNPYRQLYTVN